jgi:hypothetical protein
MEINRNKHVWEGWTVGDFIDDLSWEIKLIMNGECHQKPFRSKEELSEWCKSNQPYYKKKIAGVNNYFAQMYNLK